MTPRRRMMVRYALFSTAFVVGAGIDYALLVGVPWVDPFAATIAEAALVVVRVGLASHVALRTNGVLAVAAAMRIYLYLEPDTGALGTLNQLLLIMAPGIGPLTAVDVHRALLRLGFILHGLGALTPVIPAVSLAILVGAIAYIVSIVVSAKSQLLDG